MNDEDKSLEQFYQEYLDKTKCESQTYKQSLFNMLVFFVFFLFIMFGAELAVVAINQHCIDSGHFTVWLPWPWESIVYTCTPVLK